MKWVGGGGTNVWSQATRKVMMKRLVLLLTVILAVPLLGLVGGCGKSNDEKPAARPASAGAKDGSAPSNGDAFGPVGLALAGGTSAPGVDVKIGEANALQTVVTPDGTVYTGEMTDGRPNGRGTLTDARGTYQKGEWRNGTLYRASGTCVLPDGTKETGTWNNDGTRCGGTIWFPDGRIYKGDWVIVEGKADLPYGAGAMTWPDGRQYTGHFVAGKMDGAGKMTYPDGKISDGQWKQDEFQGPAK